MVPFICPYDAQHIEIHVQYVEKSTTSKRSTEVAEAKNLHSINPQEEQHQNKDYIDQVNINSININSVTFSSKQSVMMANLNTSSKLTTAVIPYKVDSSSDGNIMSFDIFKKLLP